MENKTQSLSNDTKKPQPASPAAESPKAKAAETRLKEMSRSAKQKGKVSEPKKYSKPMFNPNWFYIGMGVAGIVGISHLVFRTPTKTDYKFVPNKPPLKKTPHSENLSPIPKEKTNDKVSRSNNTFKLNSF